MTTLEKTNNGVNNNRNTASHNSAVAADTIQTRQGIADGGKTLPIAEIKGAFLDSRKKELEQAVRNVSGIVQNITRELNFSVDEELGRFVVTVLDQQTGEEIRQIPTEDMLELARTLAEADEDSPRGILFQGDA